MARAHLLLPAVQAVAAARPEPVGEARATRTPRALPTAEKQKALQSLAGGGAMAAGSVARPGGLDLQSVTLSAARPRIAQKAYLSLVTPAAFDPELGTIEYNVNFGGWLNIYMKVEKGASYLVDLDTQAWGDGTYRVTVGDEVMNIDKGQGDAHVLFGVQAQTDGWIRVGVRRDGTGYRLYEVAIDRAN